MLDAATLFGVIVAGYAFKLVIALIDTPFFYVGARYLGRAVRGEPLAVSTRALVVDVALTVACVGGIAVLVGVAMRWGGGGGYGWQHRAGVAAIFGAGALIAAATFGLASPARSGVSALAVASCGVVALILGLGDAAPALLLVGGMVAAAAGLIALVAARPAVVVEGGRHRR